MHMAARYDQRAVGVGGHLWTLSATVVLRLGLGLTGRYPLCPSG